MRKKKAWLAKTPDATRRSHTIPPKDITVRRQIRKSVKPALKTDKHGTVSYGWNRSCELKYANRV